MTPELCGCSEALLPAVIAGEAAGPRQTRGCPRTLSPVTSLLTSSPLGPGVGGGEKNPAVPSPTSRAPRIRPRGPASHREYRLLKRTRHFIWRCYPAFPHQRIPGMTPGRSRSRWRERPGFLSSDLSNHPSHSGPVALSKLCLL